MSGKSFPHRTNCLTHRSIRFLSWCAALLVLSGCSWLAQPDQSILTGQPCAPPCWYGIIPGKTTEEDALQVLQKSPYVQPATISIRPFEPGDGERKSIAWWPRHGYNLDFLYTRNNIVQVFTLKPEFSLSLGQVVERYGNPQAVLAWLEANEVPYNIRVYYPEIGLAAYLQGRLPNRGEPFTIAPDIGIHELEYFPVGTIDSLFEIGGTYLSVSDWSDYAKRHLQAWKGFGTIEVAPYGSP